MMLYAISIVGLFLIILMSVYMKKHPHLRRMSFRNIWSQRQKSLYALFGGIMSTALITAALQLQFSMSHSVDNYMQHSFGPIVAEISAQRQQTTSLMKQDLERLTEDMEESGFYAGFIPAMMGEATLSKRDSSGTPFILQPKTMVYSFPDMGDISVPEGESAAVYMKQTAELRPLPGEIWLDSQTAKQLETEIGQNIVVTMDGREVELRVGNIVEEKGLLAYRGEEKTTASAVVNCETAGQLFNFPVDAVNRVLLLRNNDSGSSVNYSGLRINNEWNMYFSAALAYNDLQGSTKLLPIFTIASLTSIFIGMLFTVNLFHMITEERRQEIGILRAIGMNASQTRGLLLLEGFWYALISGIIGLIVGGALSKLLVSQLGVVLRELMMNEDGLAVEFSFHMDPVSYSAALGLGIILIMLSILQVSGKPLKISIVESLKPASAEQRHTLKRYKVARWVLGGAALAALAGIIGYSMTDSFLESISFPEINPLDILFFCFVVLALAAVTSVLLLPLLLKLLYAILAPLGSWRGMLKISLRYPLYYNRRTVLQLLMFSCVLFLTCFSALFSETLGGRFGQFDPRNATGGFDRYALTSEQVTSERLKDKLEQSLYGNAKGIQYTVISSMNLPFGYKQSLYGVTEDYGKLQTMRLKQRVPELASDQEAWSKVATDPEWIIVSDSLLKAIGQDLSPGDLLITDGNSFRNRMGEENAKPFVIRKQIAAIIEGHVNSVNYPTAQGIWVSSQSFDKEYSNHQSSRLLLFKEGENAGLTAEWNALEKTLTAMNVHPLFDPQKVNEQSTGFFRVFFGLFEGFNALAAFIGSMGLLILMLRAFAERRQQFGMLRAIGVSSTHIRHGFTLEGAVIAVLGVTIGVVIGTYGGYLMVQAFMQDGKEMFSREPVSVPWSKLAVYYFGAILLTLLCTSIPARKAQKQSPAEAFRYTE
ncbi:ABC transporter permease [Paenibacillus sp. N3/727]|uniref:ABC transporter permease n=1 Tax=Paenibacillus sp. N3/727 TaxID=2925845 RepID=UPI001F532017|nr:ABC transporter permease [Paenibacillus sp. N3/727]UNK19204.1 ABC transporter permease [Paenibacillus sp. N3/727]